MKMGIAGHYKFILNGKIVGQSDNVITDGFISRWCGNTTGKFSRCYVGTGTTTPAESDVGMETFEAKSSAVYSFSITANNITSQGGNRLATGTVIHSFTGITAVITEVGMRFDPTGTEVSATGATIDSHVLVRNANGDVVGISLTPSDTLQIIFTLGWLLPTKPVSRKIMINGTNTLVTFELSKGTDNDLYSMGLLLQQRSRGGITYYHNNYNNFGKSATQGIVDNFENPPSLSTGGGGITFVEKAPINSSAVHATFQYAFDLSSWAADLAYVQFSRVSASNGVGGDGLKGGGFNFIPPIPQADLGIVSVALKFEFLRGAGTEPVTMGATILPVSITESGSNGVITTESAIAYPEYGKFPYTYLWSRVSGGTVLVCSNTTDQDPTFSYNGTSETTNEVWKCVITDKDGNTGERTITLDVTWA